VCKRQRPHSEAAPSRVAEAIDSDLSTRDCECPAGAEPILRRAWDGLLGELRHGLKMEVDISREVDLSRKLRTVFPDSSEGIRIPFSHPVRKTACKAS
jgi:hypothetical protein